MASSVKLLVRSLYPINAHFSKAFTSCCLNRSTSLTPSHLNSNRFSRYPNCIDLSVHFRQLNPERCKNGQKLLQSTSRLDFLNRFPRTFLFGKKDDNQKKKKRVPKLILLQNPLTWLMIKIDFGVLRSVWDPTFAENDFKFGTKQV